MTLRRPAGWVAVAVAAASACVENEQGTGCLPIAPESARVDRAKPRFSGPTRITNARFPVGELAQVLQLGHEGSQPLRVEVTRLPPPGPSSGTASGSRRVPLAVHRLPGRAHPRGRDRLLRQADDGSVWYFGEDAANYDDGRVADHDVYRSENIPGMVFEQDTVKATGETVPGPGARSGTWPWSRSC